MNVFGTKKTVLPDAVRENKKTRWKIFLSVLAILAFLQVLLTANNLVFSYAFTQHYNNLRNEGSAHGDEKIVLDSSRNKGGKPEPVSVETETLAGENESKTDQASDTSTDKNNNANEKEYRKLVWYHFFSFMDSALLLLVPLIAWIIAYPEPRRFWSFVRFGIVFLLCVAIYPFVVLPLNHLLRHFINSEPCTFWHLFDSDWLDVLGHFPMQLIQMAYLFGIGYAVCYWIQKNEREIQSERLQTLLAQLRHEALVGRIQPHFLFNALNTVASLVDSAPDDARNVIGRLGSLLQSSLTTVKNPLVGLSREYDLIEDYLQIQRIRYGERLKFKLVVDESIRDTDIPAFLLQPLVENSVKHGLANADTDHSVEIEVNSVESGDYVVVTVSDNGKFGELDAAKISEGVGLRVTRERLDLQYHGNASIKLSSNRAGGFTVELTLPKEIEAKT